MQNTDRPLVITTLGTCRVADPILTAVRNRPLKRANAKVYGFAHTSREILQQIAYLDGTPLPPELEPYLADPVGDTKGDVDLPADLFVVEISTTKEYRFGDWVLQTNYMERAFKNLTPLLTIFKKHGDIGRRDIRERLLAGHPLFNQASELQQRILLGGYIHKTTPKELHADLLEIKSRLKAPVLFACHIDVPDMRGRALTGRPQLCALMREMCAENDWPLLDPTPHVLAFGRAEALEDGGRDVNHYSLEFKAHYGSHIFDTFAAPLLRSQGPRAVAASAAPSPETELEERHTTLRNLLRANEFESALVLAAGLEAEAANSSRILADVAKAYAKAKAFEKAAAVRARCAELDPADASILVDVARYYAKAHSFTRSLEAANAALARDPANTAAHGLKADAMIRLRLLNGLEDTLLALPPAESATMLRGVSTLVDAGRLREAAAVLAPVRAVGDEQATAEELRANLMRQLTQRAQALVLAEDLTEAASFWRALRSIAPDNKSATLGLRRAVEPHIDEARRLVQAEAYTAATGEYRAALEIDPENARAQRELASVLNRVKDWEAATVAWLRLSELGQPAGEALARAVRSSRNANRNHDALIITQRLDAEQRSDLTDVIASLVKRVVSEMRKDFAAGAMDDAVTKARAVLAEDPENEHALKMIKKVTSAMVHAMREKKGDDHAQEVLVRRLLAVDPGHREAQRLLMRLSPEAKRAAIRAKRATANAT